MRTPQTSSEWGVFYVSCILIAILFVTVTSGNINEGVATGALMGTVWAAIGAVVIFLYHFVNKTA